MAHTSSKTSIHLRDLSKLSMDVQMLTDGITCSVIRLKFDRGADVTVFLDGEKPETVVSHLSRLVRELEVEYGLSQSSTVTPKDVEEHIKHQVESGLYF
jgi:hypothetical protein